MLGFPTGGEDRRGLLDPLPLDIGEERLAGEREEDPVKMERGEGGHPGQPGEGQGLVQPPADVVDDAIDALFVFRPGGVRPWAVPAQSPPPSPQPPPTVAITPAPTIAITAAPTVSFPAHIPATPYIAEGIEYSIELRPARPDRRRPLADRATARTTRVR